jgi:hypothetical protein
VVLEWIKKTTKKKGILVGLLHMAADRQAPCGDRRQSWRAITPPLRYYWFVVDR